MNLLPKEKKQAVKRERQRRLIVVLGFLLASLFFVAVVLLLPSFFLTAIEHKNLSRELDLSEQDKALSEAQEIEGHIKALNRQISNFNSNAKSANNPSQSFEKILAVKPAGVSVNYLEFSLFGADQKEAKPKVVLRGLAETREDFLFFLGKLRESRFFAEVDSPVSNLLKERDFEFSLDLFLNPVRNGISNGVKDNG